MKIAILSPFYPYRGGLAQLNARLYTELSEDNQVKAFTFTTLYPDFLFPGKTQYVDEADSATKIDAERILNSINPFSYIKTAQLINKYAPDILIIPYWMSFLSPAFGTVCLLLNKRIKIVSLVHNAISHERTLLEKPLAKYFFNRCNGFIVMSEPVQKDLLLLKKNANILLQPHPIYDQYGERTDKTNACQKLGISPDKKNLLFFGLIRDYKGLDILIESMSYLDNSYQLVIAGESYGSFEKYQNLIDKSPLRDNIKVFEQYIPDDMVSTLFSASDVLVLPYRSATQSGVVAMAYQLELPMIATNVGALGCTVENSGTGLLVSTPDAQEIAGKITEFFSMDSHELFMQNLKKEKIRLSWANFTRSTESFLSEIVAS
ncbi:glycosyltransferase involved in cell wall biosynthesis [Dysgonomonas hofstadii]|uniref:Glycosyltransferase involved in cell wall biosynthesis n=1 Tax=Dysgonomonas hofstadii TaxID=637886 RepID=A0A840CJY5_9BACT|nr:glycosyltransferase [Dysgonomonas hofstadii]MBB4036270.1 glycosyltransferase involved in cell wall biosynthesis [Dysgonomonas hofstadii]